MYKKLLLAALVMSMLALSAATAQQAETPKIISWSNSKTTDAGAVLRVKTGDKLTFTITTNTSCEHGWTVRQGAKVLTSQVRQGVKQSRFVWQVPQTKGTWTVEAAAYGYKAPVGPIAKAQKTWSVTTGVIKTVKPGESIQAAIDALPPEGGVVELAAGTFVLSQSGEITRTTTLNQSYYGSNTRTGKYRYAVLINKENVTVRGAGIDKTKLVSKGKTLPPFHMILVLECSNVTISDVFLRSGLPETGYIPNNVSGAKKWIAGVPKNSKHEIGLLAPEGHGIHLLRRARNVDISRVRIGRLSAPVTTGGGSIWQVTEDAVREITVRDCVFLRNRGGILFVNTYNNTVIGCEVGYAQAWMGIDLNVRCSDNVIEKNIFHHSANSGMKVYGGCQRNVFRDNICYENGRSGGHGMWVWSTPTDTTIVNNTFRDNRHDGVCIKEQGTVHNTLVLNNRIYNNGRHGISLLNRPRGAAGAPASPWLVAIKSNTIFSNKEDGIRQAIKHSKVTLSGNIVAGNGGHGISRSDSEMILLHNSVWNNKGGDYKGCSAGTGSICSDPLFADPSKGDFHLKSKAGRWDTKTGKWVKDAVHSHCIDAGDPKADYSREPAPNGGCVNMGAYGNTGEASKSATRQKGHAGEIMSKKKQSIPQPQALAKRLEEHLEKNILSFLLRHSPDKEYGGFVTQLDRQGKWYGKRTKRLVPQARMVWTFASAHRAGLGDGKYLQAARDGFPFLLKHMWDEKEGGWYWSVTRRGKPGSTRKRIYGQAFGIYGPCEYYFAGGDKEALRKAEETFDLLEKHAYDKKHGGYFTCNFTRDWKRQGSGKRSAGTHLHLVESLVSLVRATGKEKYRKRLKELLDILVDKMFLPEHGCNVEVYTEDWKPIIESDTLYVHDLEAAWLIIDAAKALGLQDKKYLERARNLVDYSMKYAWDEKNGGFFQKGPPGRPATNTDKNYNVQGEGLVALATLFRETGDKKYFQKLVEHARWCMEVQADSEFGEWFTICTADGKVKMEQKASLWKAGYHHPRGCLYAAVILKGMKESKK